MKSPMLAKVSRDLLQDRGKTLMLVLAIAMGILSLGTMLNAYAVLSREMSANYLGTHPAMATIKVENGSLGPEIEQQVAAMPGIAGVEQRATVMARMKVGQDWYPLLLFVVADFNHLKLNTFTPISGEWPPTTGTMLVERTALQVMHASQGDSLTIKTPHGTARSVNLSGVVHDPGLAPAWQEKMGYGYISLATWHQLGEAQGLDELRFRFKNNPASLEQIDSQANQLALRLQKQGHQIHEIQVPPPGRHPHQGQMTAVLSLFSLFGFCTLILASILVATAMATLMVRQTRQIGVMKSIGAKSSQILRLYLGMVTVIALLALIIGIPLSQLLAGVLIEKISILLNLAIVDHRIPLWVPLIQMVSGLLIPLMVCYWPVRKASRMTPWEAMGHHGIGSANGQPHQILRGLTVLNSSVAGFNLAVRNAFRQQSRLLMTLLLLASGGALFMSALNLSQAWEQSLRKIYQVRFYDLEIQLAAAPDAKVLDLVKRVAGVQKVEGWQMLPMAFYRGTTFSTIRTYPDKRHGSSFLFGLDPRSELVRFPVLAGRWLQPGARGEVVLNHLARFQMPEIKVGDTIQLLVEGQKIPWHVVGFVEDIGSPAASAYVSRTDLNQVLPQAGAFNLLRIAMIDKRPEAARQLARELETTLAGTGTAISETYPMAEIRNAVADHMKVLVNALLALAVLVGLVGVLGLASTMSMNVLERTREFGVLRAIGALKKDIYQLVMAEGILMGLLSLVFGIGLSLVLSGLIGNFIGNMAFRTPLALAVSGSGILIWIGLLIVGSLLASYFPAKKASQMITREALQYE